MDDEVKTNIPKADSKDDEGNYYKVGVSCDNDIKGEWDYNAWTLKLDNVINGTKCRLTFTSTMSQTERDNIIKQGVQIRRNTYRGKDITEYYNDGTLFEMIKSGKFDDIYVGDYFTGESGKIWLIADLDNYWHQGYKNGDNTGYNNMGLSTHHATIIPDGSLMGAPMNQKKENKDTTEGGYAGSEMIRTLDETILPEYITPDFGTHVLEYQNLLSAAVDTACSNMYGQTTGASSVWQWDSRKLDLMSEVNVFGTTVWSSSGNDVGLDNRQYAIFQLRPELINQTMNGTPFTYWLKAVADSTHFAFVGYLGEASTYVASSSRGIRPRFLIGTLDE